MKRVGNSDGSVTAELVIALPAVILVLSCCLGALSLGAARVRLQDAAAAVARSVARGGAATAAGGANVAQHDDGDLLCVTVTASGSLGVLGTVPLTATSCALHDGR